MNDQSTIEQMIVQRKDEERANRKKLQEAKRLFDAEAERISREFKEKSEMIVKHIEQKLRDNPELEALLSDREFTDDMLPYMDELNMGTQFNLILKENLSDEFHIYWIETEECALSWYQDVHYRKDDDGFDTETITKATDTIPYKNFLQAWLKAGDKYTSTFNAHTSAPNEPHIEYFEVCFAEDSGGWFIQNAQMFDPQGRYVPLLGEDAIYAERFKSYEELAEFIDESVFAYKF